MSDIIQELESERVSLMEEVTANKRKMKDLEDNLLYRLTSTQGSLVEDESLIAVLGNVIFQWLFPSAGCLADPENPETMNDPKFDLVALRTLNSEKFKQMALETINIIPKGFPFNKNSQIYLFFRTYLQRSKSQLLSRKYFAQKMEW